MCSPGQKPRGGSATFTGGGASRARTYDHRLIDGADAARFLCWIANAREQPLAVALER
jgi:hypothetical protein